MFCQCERTLRDYSYRISRGGSRTSPRRGRQSLEGGRLPNILIKFSENPMKLKKFWSVGGRMPGAPPLNPPLISTTSGNQGKLEGIFPVREFHNFLKNQGILITQYFFIPLIIFPVYYGFAHKNVLLGQLWLHNKNVFVLKCKMMFNHV